MIYHLNKNLNERFPDIRGVATFWRHREKCHRATEQVNRLPGYERKYTNKQHLTGGIRSWVWGNATLLATLLEILWAFVKKIKQNYYFVSLAS